MVKEPTEPYRLIDPLSGRVAPMRTRRAETLFDPLSIKGMALKNRFVVPAMQRGMCADGAPTPELAEYYQRRIEGGFSLIISESCAVNHPSSTQQVSAAWMTERTQPAWRTCVQSVHKAGGRLFIQLWHEGATRKVGGSGPLAAHDTISPSGLIHPGKRNGRAASGSDLEEIKQAYVDSALMAQQIGADGVEIHAAHGYLLDQFLWSETNLRSDGYGGSNLQDRLRFPAEVLAAVRTAVGPRFPISFRFSQWKEVDFDAKIVRTPAELELLLSTIESAGADVVHVSTRRFYKEEWAESPRSLAGWVKTMTDLPVVAVGSVGVEGDIKETFTGADSRLDVAAGVRELHRRHNQGEFDLVAVGRSSISEPDWVQKVRQGRFNEIRPFTGQLVKGESNWDSGFVDEAHQNLQPQTRETLHSPRALGVAGPCPS